jgi:hypothetical protein
MKHQFLLLLCLLGAVLLWPGCVDGDTTNPTCELNTPIVAMTGGCARQELVLTGLMKAQAGSLPNIISDQCSFDPATRRIVKIEPSSDGQFYLHLYIGIPATVTFQVFGGDCEEIIAPITECISTEAVAFSQEVITGGDFPDIYVILDYKIFSRPLYANYVMGARDYIAVGALDELPQNPVLKYHESDNGPRRLHTSCSGSTQRVIIGSCNPQADVAGWAMELGLPISETYSGDGGTYYALELEDGLSPNSVGGDGPGGTTNPSTPIRRPKQDSLDLFIEEDFLIEAASPGNGLFNPFTYDNFAKTIQQTGDCLLYRPGRASVDKPDGNVIVAMIDGGVEDGIWNEEWNRHLYQEPFELPFQSSGSLGYDFIRDDAMPNDEAGHGTATASTVIGGYTGEFPLAMVHYKIFGEQNLATYFGAVVATNTAVDLGANIINMSWGIPQEKQPIALTCAIDRAMAAGLVVVTTAGNESRDISAAPQWPANYSSLPKYDRLVTVASYWYPSGEVNDSPRKIDYSNFARFVDIAAYLTSLSLAYGATDPAADGAFAFIAGTSISAPLVTRSIAFYARPNQTNFAAWQREQIQQSNPLLTNGHTEGGNYLPICPE